MTYFTADGMIAARMREAANNPRATEMELLTILHSDIVMKDVYETCVDRLKEEYGWDYDPQ